MPLLFFTASSTAAGVRSSFAPMAVISPRIGAIKYSGYGMSLVLSLVVHRLDHISAQCVDCFSISSRFGFEFVPGLPLRAACRRCATR